MPLSYLITILIFLLFALFSLVAVGTALKRSPKKDLKILLDSAGKFFFYRNIHNLLKNHTDETLLFANTVAQNIVRFLYGILCVYLLIVTKLVVVNINVDSEIPSLVIQAPWAYLVLLISFLTLFILGDFCPRLFGAKYPNLAMKLCATLASLIMLIVFPFTYLLLKFSSSLSQRVYLHQFSISKDDAKQELIDIIEESDVSSRLDPHDKKLIESVMSFKDRIAREVMVPRVEVFSLPDDTTIEAAALALQKEGYSRTPVFHDTLDHIIGVLMYKDILTKYMEYTAAQNNELLKAPISTLVKNVLYTPETKKISHLLQEFRKKQVHLAIIVDEYGGTEGIVTIEDILEAIVGEIADEYDTEEALFISLPEGGWIIDARMPIFDIEEQLGIEIPQDGDYDTIGGYVFHETGTIPTKGFVIKKPNFELVVLRSDDRRVEKIKIKPILTKNANNESST